MSSAEYRRKCIEYERRIAELEKYSKWGGWKGTSERRMEGMLAYKCFSNDGGTALSLLKYGAWYDAGAINEDAPCDIGLEGRIYCAFGDDGNGYSTPAKWDYDAIMLMGRLYSAVYGNARVFTLSPSVRRVWLPTIIAVYPILDQWQLPADLTSNVPWASQPRTTFSDNLLGGSPSGHINPATNDFDNYLAHCQVGNLMDCSLPLEVGTTNIKDDTVLVHCVHIGADGKSYININADVGNISANLPPSLGVGTDDMNTGCKMVFMRNGVIPSDPIYGLAFIVMTLDDMQLWRILGAPFSGNGNYFVDPGWSSNPYWYLWESFEFGTEFGFLQRSSWFPNSNPEHELIFTTDEITGVTNGVPLHNIALNPTGQKILSLNLA